MKQKFTRNQINGFMIAIRQIILDAKKGIRTNGQFAYGIKKISNAIQSELESIDAYEKEHLKEYNEERNALLKTFEKKKGTEEIENVIIPANSIDAMNKLKILNEKHKIILEAHKAFMNGEVELDLWLIDVKDIPTEISYTIIDNFDSLIIEKIKMEIKE